MLKSEKHNKNNKMIKNPKTFRMSSSAKACNEFTVVNSWEKNYGVGVLFTEGTMHMKVLWTRCHILQGADASKMLNHK